MFNQRVKISRRKRKERKKNNKKTISDFEIGIYLYTRYPVTYIYIYIVLLINIWTNRQYATNLWVLTVKTVMQE